MFDLLQPPSTPTATAVSVEHAAAGNDSAGAGTHPPAPWLALMLDEIDYGMLLLADESNVLHANHVARSELDASHPLQLLGRQLRVRQAADLGPLRAALADAVKRGLRRLVTLGQGEQRITLAVVPLAGTGASAADDKEPLTLLVFGKRHVCPALSAHWFARSHGLTPAETRVLAALCDGQAPSVIAKAQSVAMSTVRSQIGAIRAKTGAAGIRALVRQVAVLPPLVNALRGVTATALH
jgi:DNA-binding CsgD family transcriptional regulator